MIFMCGFIQPTNAIEVATKNFQSNGSDSEYQNANYI